MPRAALKLLPRPPLSRPSLSLEGEASLAESVRLLLHHPPFPLEPSLDALRPLLTPRLVSDVLEPLPPSAAAAAFRFFSWATFARHLRSPLALSLLVRLLSSRPSGLPSAWMSLELMRRDGVPASPHAFEALIRAYDLRASPSLALLAFHRMPDFASRPNVFVYNALLSALIRSPSLFPLSMALYSRMRKLGHPPNRSTFSVLIAAHCRHGSSADALHLFDEMSASGLPPDTMVYNLVIHVLCRAGRVKDALGLLETMRHQSLPPCAVTCGTLVDGLCRAGNVDMAFGLVEEFANEGMVLGMHVYTSLIGGLFRSGRFKDACWLFANLPRDNVLPDLMAYTSMIKGYADSGRIREAFSFLGEMIKRGIEPDMFCYNTLMKGLCDAGDLDQAFTLMTEVSRDRGLVDPETYNILISALCDNGRVAEAQKYFVEMCNKGCLPTVVTFNTLISGLCRFNKVDEAHTVFCKMETPRKLSLFLRVARLESHGRSLQGQVEHLCQSGKVLQAFNLLKLLTDCGIVRPDISTYTILIDNLCKDNKYDEALKLLNDARSSGLVPDAITYGVLINRLQSHNKFEEALAFIDDVFLSGCTPSLPLYYIMMKALCKMKNVTRAVNIWLSYISKSNELSFEQAKYISWAKKHFESGSVLEMSRCLVQMDIKWHTHYSSPSGIWLSGFCKADQLDEAYQIFSVHRAYKIEMSSYSCVTLFQALCRNRRLHEAVDVLFHRIGRGYEVDSHHGNFLLQKLSGEGATETVKALAAQMGKSGYNLYTYLEEKTKKLLYKNSSHKLVSGTID